MSNHPPPPDRGALDSLFGMYVAVSVTSVADVRRGAASDDLRPRLKEAVREVVLGPRDGLPRQIDTLERIWVAFRDPLVAEMIRRHGSHPLLPMRLQRRLDAAVDGLRSPMSESPVWHVHADAVMDHLRRLAPPSPSPDARSMPAEQRRGELGAALISRSVRDELWMSPERRDWILAWWINRGSEAGVR